MDYDHQKSLRTHGLCPTCPVKAGQGCVALCGIESFEATSLDGGQAHTCALTGSASLYGLGRTSRAVYGTRQRRASRYYPPCASTGSALPAWSRPGRVSARCMATRLGIPLAPLQGWAVRVADATTGSAHLVWFIPDGAAPATPKLPSQ
jgi:hypothetical protein